MADGTTYETFQQELEPLLRKRGWWGRQNMVDPLTGEAKIVQLGSPRRLRIIFDTNIRMAYARGQWERIARVAEARPFLRYVTVGDNRVRDEHRPWHGTVLRWDHPFWKTHYPPNGWACRCTVQQYSADDLKTFGFKVSDEPPPGWDSRKAWTNKRTGRVYQVPRGIAPGFQHNVGRINPANDDADRLIARIDDTDPDLQRAAVGQPWQTDLFRRHAAGDLAGDWPIAITQGAVAKHLGARSSVVRLSQYTSLKQTRNRAGQNFSPQYYSLVQRALDMDHVWFDDKSPGWVHAYAELDGRWWHIVLRRIGGDTYLSTLHRIEATRAGRAITKRNKL